ncbi:MAG: chromosomal replication initiator protein DnaA [Limnochordales bacterium]|nr:chromosomal replication initiator protein DnaA [Limnochordales bacterium]
MQDAETIWTQTLALLAEHLDPDTFSAWLSGARPLGVHGNTLLVEIPNEFARDWLNAQYHDFLHACLAQIVGEGWNIRFLLPNESPPRRAQVARPASALFPPVTPETQPIPGVLTRQDLLRDARSGRTPVRSQPLPASPAMSEVAAARLPSNLSARPSAGGTGTVITPPSISLPPIQHRDRDDLVLHLNPKYTFDTFVVGANNRFAHAACLAVAESPAESYNPLFLYGGVGLGKTHLMQAICHYVLERSPNARVMYVTSEKFTNELINGIQKKAMDQFRARYRTLDILLIDDIQFVAGKDSTQEEFFHTFNALYEANKQIVISSDRPPKEIPTLEERLRSRFEWGLMADIAPPDFETRIAILQRKAALDNLEVSPEVITYLAEQIQSNIRELEGALNRVVAYASLAGRELTVDLAREALKPMLSSNPMRVTVAAIQKVVAEYFGVPLDELRGKRRSRSVAFPRQIAMYLARELTDASLPQIGEEFGRDHTTVLHACEKVKAELAQDRSLQVHLQTLKERLLRNS